MTATPRCLVTKPTRCHYSTPRNKPSVTQWRIQRYYSVDGANRSSAEGGRGLTCSSAPKGERCGKVDAPSLLGMRPGRVPRLANYMQKMLHLVLIFVTILLGLRELTIN